MRYDWRGEYIEEFRAQLPRLYRSSASSEQAKAYSVRCFVYPRQMLRY